MGKLLRVEISQLLRRPAVIGLMITMLVVAYFHCHFNYHLLPPIIGGNDGTSMFSPDIERMRGEYAFYDTLQSFVYPMFFAPFCAPFMVGWSFSERSVNGTMVYAYSRRQTALAKVLSFYVVGLLICLLPVVYAAIIYCLPWLAQLTLPQVGKLLTALLFTAIFHAGLLSIPMLLTFICKDLLKSTLCSIAALTTVILLPGKVGVLVRVLFVMGYMDVYGAFYFTEGYRMHNSTQWLWLFAAFSLVLCVVCTWGSVRAFRKAELW